MSGVSEICKESGLKPEQVTNVFETILAMVAGGEKVRVKGFGSFERKLYHGRTLTTPAVNGGQPMKYPDSYLLKFHQSNLAKRRINIAAKKAKRAAKEQAATEPALAKKPKKGAVEVVDVPTPSAKKPKKSVPPPAAKKKKPKAKPADSADSEE